ncbi:MAG TPA: alpha/beta fold hydrolase, partial [Terriglobia bacterium]|nr:alpha/beta fold hydrolase [Terriglobia bacterium]
EIESVLDEHTDVAQSVVMLREDRPGDKRLAAYCVPSTAIACEPERLRKFLGQRLPDYMVPSAYVFLQTFPLTPSGKVDRRALPSISAADRRSADFIEPRDNIERKLTKIWEELLGVKLIGMKDNFFDLGGHSLLATQLIARIEKTLGSVSLSSLFQSPTIESLARELRQKKKADKDSSLVLFRSGGSRPPLFVHGGSFELSRHLGDDQPCYGIRPHGQDGRKAPATVEEMAADYLRQIRGVQPQGPYLIGGFSFGGLVAWEMAQQLRESGQEVALLVLIDPSPPYSSTSQPPSNDSRRNSTLNRHLTALRQADPRPLVAALRSRGQRMVNALKRRVCVAYLKFGHRIPSSLRLFYFFEMSEEATRKYLPRPYPGRTVLLSAQPDTVGLWRSLVVGSLEVHHLQGHHLDAIKGPRVELWAKQLKSSLSNAL